MPQTKRHFYSSRIPNISDGITPLVWWCGNQKSGSWSSPLRREDSVKHGVLPVLGAGRQHEHVLDYVEGEAIIRQRAQELSLQEGRPFLLQHPLASHVTLQHKYCRFGAVWHEASRGRKNIRLTPVWGGDNASEEMVWRDGIWQACKRHEIIMCTIWYVAMAYLNMQCILYVILYQEYNCHLYLLSSWLETEWKRRVQRWSSLDWCNWKTLASYSKTIMSSINCARNTDMPRGSRLLGHENNIHHHNWLRKKHKTLGALRRANAFKWKRKRGIAPRQSFFTDTTAVIRRLWH